jgi:hypothetical protein
MPPPNLDPWGRRGMPFAVLAILGVHQKSASGPPDERPLHKTLDGPQVCGRARAWMRWYGEQATDSFSDFRFYCAESQLGTLPLSYLRPIGLIL